MQASMRTGVKAQRGDIPQDAFDEVISHSDFLSIVEGASLVQIIHRFVEEMNLAQIEPRTLVNARVGLSKDKWSADLWGKNIFDKEYIANSFFIVSGVGYTASYGEKASYGLTVRYQF